MKKKEKKICFSGGAEGADAFFEHYSEVYSIEIVSFSYKTKFHKSQHKRELTEEEFLEGIQQVIKANQILKRSQTQRYYKFLARNWFQIKYVEQVFAIGEFVSTVAHPFAVKGGTAWAIEMAKSKRKEIYFFDQKNIQWFVYDYCYNNFLPFYDVVQISKTKFAGIGTRKINIFGIQAIENLFKNSFDAK